MMIGDARTDRGDDPGEIHPQFRETSIDGREQAHRDQDVGEVDAGDVDGNLDLPRPR